MKQRIAAFLMCVICLLSVVGCGQTKADTNTPSAANQQTVTDDYLTTISGTYVELFPELSKADYRSIWHDATAPLVGEDNADAATDKLLGMCTQRSTAQTLPKNMRPIRTAWPSTAISWAGFRSS